MITAAQANEIVKLVNNPARKLEIEGFIKIAAFKGHKYASMRLSKAEGELLRGLGFTVEFADNANQATVKW